jgi:hypothetical protein
LDPWQDGGAFLSNSVEAPRIESKDAEDGGSDLRRLDKTGDGPAMKVRVGHEQHDIRVIVGQAAVLGLFLQAARVDHADIGDERAIPVRER